MPDHSLQQFNKRYVQRYFQQTRYKRVASSHIQQKIWAQAQRQGRHRNSTTRLLYDNLHSQIYTTLQSLPNEPDDIVVDDVHVNEGSDPTLIPPFSTVSTLPVDTSNVPNTLLVATSDVERRVNNPLNDVDDAPLSTSNVPSALLVAASDVEHPVSTSNNPLNMDNPPPLPSPNAQTLDGTTLDVTISPFNVDTSTCSNDVNADEFHNVNIILKMQTICQRYV
ncbi:hypothetical protein H0H93_016359 [Arthromyces matolae]|nr:hypothetical protein H0H93_016359 [Arthromyces matolae]